MEITTAWENLFHAVKALEARQGDWEVMAATCMAAMEMLLEFPPGEVLEVVEKSELPTRATISWLAFEGSKLGGDNRERALGLAAHWEAANPGEKLIAPPPGAPDKPLVIH
ncbi:MAG: hypothetical protein KQH53_19220 [Desulfarculaceae bacterium]|nr:hypothetical protein [Desulfarculaceae bacterium]